MFSWINHSRVIYILSNLFVLPAILIPKIDFLSNFSAFVSLLLLGKTNILLSLTVFVVFMMKNNSNYRFNLLIKIKGVQLSKSDYECVYLFAWSTFLRYILIGIVTNQIFILLI